MASEQQEAATAEPTTAEPTMAGESAGEALAGEAPAAPDGEVEFAAALDLGADTSVATRVSTRSLKSEILRNDLSNQKTPMVLSFAGGHRSFGEVAVQLRTTNKDVSADALLQLLDHSLAEPAARDALALEPLLGRWREHEALGRLLEVEVEGEQLALRSEQLLAMMLAKLDSFTRGQSNTRMPLALVVPDSFTLEQRQAVRDAAHIGGLDLRKLVTRCEAAAMDYGTKRSAEALGQTAVVLVDVGHTYASAAVVSWDGKAGKVVASACEAGAGGEAVERALFETLSADCERRKGAKVAWGSKAAIRLMTQVRKLKESLSAVPEASVSCESLVNDEDVQFKLTRGEMEEACAEVRERIEAMLGRVVKAAGEEVMARVESCELVGGGMRVPFVKEAVTAALGEGVKLGYTMDSMSAVAVGASLCCAQLFEPKTGLVRPAFENLAKLTLSAEAAELAAAEEMTAEAREASKLMSAAELEAAVALEQRLREVDEKVAALHRAKDKLERKVFETRALVESSQRPHVELVDKEACLRVVNEFDDWLNDYEEGGGCHADTPRETFEAKLEALTAALEPSCSAYWAKLEEDRVAMEQEMEAQAAQAAAELEASGGKDDHDQRKLKKPERMRKVMLNKEEGTTLFKDGNLEAATLRYVRALQHCDKFFDLSPEDEKEVEAIKLSLHLNCAQCSLKLAKWPEAVKSARQALELDPASTKALYRLAFAQENMKAFDEAKSNLTRAQELAPEDKAIQRLLERVNLQLKREAARAKKMAQKMFG